MRAKIVDWTWRLALALGAVWFALQLGEALSASGDTRLILPCVLALGALSTALALSFAKR